MIVCISVSGLDNSLHKGVDSAFQAVVYQAQTHRFQALLALPGNHFPKRIFLIHVVVFHEIFSKICYESFI